MIAIDTDSVLLRVHIVNFTMGVFHPSLYLGLCLSLLNLHLSEAVSNNLNFRINTAGQIEAGRDSNQCLSIKADFSKKFKLSKPDEGSIQVLTETCVYHSAQLFRQVYIDESLRTEFAICLEKYYRLYGKDSSVITVGPNRKYRPFFKQDMVFGR